MLTTARKLIVYFLLEENHLLAG
jgi:hypothetical protein